MADQAEVTVNGNTFKEGDTITYTLNIKGLERAASGIDVRINYDPEVLEVLPDTADTPVFIGGFANLTGIEGTIAFNAASIAGFDTSSEGTKVMSVSFKIKEGAGKDSVDISHEVVELFYADDDDYNNVTDYEPEEIVQLGTVDVERTPLGENAQEVDFLSENPNLFWSLNMQLIIIICIVAVVIIAAVIAFVLLRKKKKVKQADENVDPIAIEENMQSEEKKTEDFQGEDVQDEDGF